MGLPRGVAASATPMVTEGPLQQQEEACCFRYRTENGPSLESEELMRKSSPGIIYSLLLTPSLE